jgi:hypothetical protein
LCCEVDSSSTLRCAEGEGLTIARFRVHEQHARAVSLPPIDPGTISVQHSHNNAFKQANVRQLRHQCQSKHMESHINRSSSISHSTTNTLEPPARSASGLLGSLVGSFRSSLPPFGFYSSKDPKIDPMSLLKPAKSMDGPSV